MLSLIKKDFLVHSWPVYGLILLIIAFITLTTLPAVFVTLLSLFGLAFSLFQYDYMRKVNLFLKSMPIRIRQIVISRYLFSIVLTGTIILIQWGLQFLFVYSTGTFNPVYQWQDYYVFFMLFCLIIGLFFPIIYFFKNIYVAMTVISVLVVVGTFYMIDILVKVLHITDEIIFNDLDAGLSTIVEQLFPFSPYFMLFIITGILLYGSVICSIYLFKRKIH